MAGKKREISDEERERRRQNAIALRDAGKIGPQFGKLGGRPRKPRATEYLEEKAREHADELMRVFLNIIQDEDTSNKDKLAAANSWLDHATTEANIQIKEEKLELDIDKSNREDLINYIGEALANGQLTEALEALEPAIEGSAEDITTSE